MDLDFKITPYRTSIKGLYSSLGIIPTARKDFKCCFYKECSKPERTGDWLYVGADYGEASISGKKTKILFVAMDGGGVVPEYSEEQRFEDAQSVWHGAVENPGNPHMSGVHLIMKKLVDEENPSIFANQLALTNSVKCTKYTKVMKTTSTSVMIGNCSNHLLEEIKCLEPNLIITQGSFPKRSVTYRLKLNGPPIYRFPNSEGRGVAEIFKSEEWLVLATPHPARLKGMSWNERRLPTFFNDAIQKGKEIISY